MIVATSRRPAIAAAFLCLYLVFQSAPTFADQEASNWAHITTDPWGRCYARSAPASDYGNEGLTEIFVVGDLDEPDRKVASHDFYSLQIYLDCHVQDQEGQIGVAMAALGPWARGHQPDAKTLALALFYDGRELARYSTLEISGGDPAAIDCSVSHYQVLGPIDGYGRNEDDHEVFVATTVDGRVLTFDATTGLLVSSDEGPTPEYGVGECF